VKEVWKALKLRLGVKSGGKGPRWSGGCVSAWRSTTDDRVSSIPAIPEDNGKFVGTNPFRTHKSRRQLAKGESETLWSRKREGGDAVDREQHRSTISGD
jgi:hypothetical protein